MRVRRAPRLQFTSMIDIIFLLLIFFMATTTLAPPEAQLASALQAQREGGRAADLEPQVIDVMLLDGDAIYRFGERVLRSQEDLTALLREMPKEGGVFVRVADDVRVGWAAAALQASKDAGFTKVTYVPAP
jgi:biopolymer transport protein ExbD